MKLVSNRVPPQNVRETDTAWVISDVPFIKPMRLAGGYVPEANIRETASEWDDVPATLNHPRGPDGEPVSANIQPETHVGTVENPHWDGEAVRATVRIRKTDLNRLGGEADDLRRALESGQQVRVSSQYLSENAPPGEYDGKRRSSVEQIVQPDSVAILPNRPAQCSIKDGCGINPTLAANSEVRITMQANAKHYKEGDLVQWPWSGGTAQGRVTEVITEPGTVERTIEGTTVTREVTEDEAAYVLDVWRGDEFSGQALKSGPELSEWSDAPEEATANRADDGTGPEDRGTSANQMSFALTDATPDDVDGYTDDEWNGDMVTSEMPNPSESDDAAGALDAAHLIHPTADDARDSKGNWKLPFRAGPDAPVNTRALVAARAAISGARGGVDAPEEDLQGADARAVDFLVDAPDDLFGSMEEDAGSAHMDMEDNTLRQVGASVMSALGVTDDNAQSRGKPRSQKVTEIVSNSPLTEDALQARCDEGIDAIHRDVMANAAVTDGATETDSDADTETTETTDMSENADETVTITDAELEEMVEEKAREIVANREEQNEKEDLATEIVANSAEYEDTDAVLEDFPTTAALETKKEQVTPDAAALPGRGASTQQANTADTDDEYPDMQL